jgi:TRAP-type C4-dicarboxylate transport system permease small subunit
MDKNNSNSPLRKFFGAAEKVELALGGFCLATLFVVVLIGIVSRLLNIQAAWYEETTRVFFLWMMWIGVGAGFNHSESSRVTVLVKALPEGVRKVCNVLYYVICFAMFAIIIGYGFRSALQQARMGEMGSALRIPMWLVGIAVPVGGIFGFIGTLNTLLFERWRLKTTAEELELEEIAAQTKKQIAEEEAKEKAGRAAGGKRR